MTNAPTSWKIDTSRGKTRGDASSQWYHRPADERFESLDEMAKVLGVRKGVARQPVIDVTKFRVEPHPEPRKTEDFSQLTVLAQPEGEPEREFDMTHYSFGQLAGLSKAPTAWLRKIGAEGGAALVADNINFGMDFLRASEDVRAYYLDEPARAPELRAVTGVDYGRVYDHDVVNAVRTIAGDGLGESRWKVPGTFDWRTKIYNPDVTVTKDNTTLFASDRDVFIFLVDDRNPIEVGKLATGEPDYMFRGFIVSNSEVGTRTLRVQTFYLRGVCMNRMQWGVEEFREIAIRHTRRAPDRFIQEAKPALESFASGSERKLQEGVDKAKAAEVAHDDDKLLEFLAKRGHSKARQRKLIEIHEREEGTPIRSAWDYANAVTAVAREIPNNDVRYELEREAGKVLDKVA